MNRTARQPVEEDVQSLFEDCTRPIVSSPISDEPLTDEAINFLCDAGPPARSQTVDATLTRLVGPCSDCGRDLPWPLPRPGFWAVPVPCPECRRWYFIEGRNEAKPELHQPAKEGESFVRGMLRAFSAQRQSPASDTLFTNLVGSDAYLRKEYRGTTRQDVTRPVVVVPLDRAARPCGNSEKATLLNISQGGAGLLVKAGKESPLVLIDFSATGAVGVQLIAQVGWRQTDHGYTKLGCEFLHPSGSPLPLH